MKKKKDQKSLTSNFFSSKKNIVMISVIAAVILLLSFLFMFIESGYGKLIIINKTDLNLEYVKASFVNAEGSINDGIQTGKIAAKKTLRTDIDEVNLFSSDSNLEVGFQFENYTDLFTDAGIFNEKFEGNMTISFIPTDDPNLITLKIKASNGIFRTKTIDCDEQYTINLSEGKILE